MTRQWTGFGVFSPTLLPAGVAPLTGRVPQRLRPAPMRPRGLSLLAPYTAVPLNAVPRTPGASPSITLVATGLGTPVIPAGCITAIVTAQQAGETAR
ncbi:hypothetical protein A4U61_32835 [Streptomyces sp. H-KF8]|uniref:hypothetical protein n=1 Tax=Streptomyces sp. H-KF8 TaxID=1727216 RepID=UPI0007ED4DB5|nr:hypothetical protein [Streptomyces sp. H-KF8]OBQ49658.1 hypothetical protein A4U61_32835 [Streptomyces sp. H-KF8]